MKVSPREFLWREWYLGEARFKGMGMRSFPKPFDLWGHPNRLERPFWFPRLAAFVARRKLTPQINPLTFWRSRGLWEAWGLQSQFTIDRLCQVAQGRGCSWIAVQDSAVDRPLRDQIKASCKAHGLKLVVWEWPGLSGTTLDLIRYWQPDGYAANIEERRDWDPFAATVAGAFPNLPKAIITNLWGAGAVPTSISQTGYSRREAEVWSLRGFACITENYMWNEQGFQPSLAPATTDWTAKTHLGYPETFPCFGIYRCSPDFYDPYKQPFPYHSWYLAEYLPEMA